MVEKNNLAGADIGGVVIVRRVDADWMAKWTGS